MEGTSIKLTQKNLVKYGETVLERNWMTTNKSLVEERFIIWDPQLLGGVPDAKFHKQKQMWLHTSVNGEFISMKKL